MHSICNNNFEYKLKSNKFVITTEIGPPKGTDTDNIKKNVKSLSGIVDAFNISDNQGSNMKLGGLSVSHLLVEKGLEPIFQITCRDRNRLALQSDLLSAYVLGIKNVLVLTGDYTTIGDHPQAKSVFDLDSVQLLQVIKNLEQGYDIAGNALSAKPVFFKGAAVNTDVANDISFKLQIIKMIKKIEAGAEFFQTMPVFNINRFKEFIYMVNKLGINVPVIAGVQLVKSEKMALYMNKFIPGIKIPDSIIAKISAAADKVSTSIDIAAGIIKEIRTLCSGIHIGAQGWEKYIPILIKEI